MNEANLKRTPLYDCHLKLGAKLVPFAGWEMPVLYSGIIEEHRAVRERAGIFDVSHMGEIVVHGPEALQALEYMTCNDVASLVDGKAQYTAIINDNGGVVDDIIIYRFAADRYFICVNASNTHKDYEWLCNHNKFNAVIEDISSEYAQIALQGPRAWEVLKLLCSDNAAHHLKYFHFCEVNIQGADVIVARTGYTGEDGCELFIPNEAGAAVWDALLELGLPFGILPAGLGARDTLRLEACFPLHGHELGDDITAIESGLGWIVKEKKSDFIGKSILINQKAKGSPRSLAGFYVMDAGIVREREKVFAADGKEIGVVTSGTKTPTVNRALGLALIDSKYCAVGTEIFVEVRGRKLKCLLEKKPFYKRKE